MVTRRELCSQCLWWTAILSSALLLKFYYSVATANDLQWILRPLAFLTETLTGLQFVMDSTGAWVNARNNVAIVKSCAGINFMVLSLPAYALAFRTHAVFAARSGRWWLKAAGGVAACVTAVWIAALLVNTARVIVSIHLYRSGFTFAGLGSEQIHQMAGVLIFFPALWAQFHWCGRLRAGRAWILAVACYLGMVIVLPILTGNFHADPKLFYDHVRITVGLTVLSLLLGYMIRVAFRFFRFSGTGAIWDAVVEVNDRGARGSAVRLRRPRRPAR